MIGKKGADIEKLREELSKMTGGDVTLNIVEIRKPEIDAKLVADNIAQQLSRRVAFCRNEACCPVGHAPWLGEDNVVVVLRYEIARAEWYREGRVPLHTPRGYRLRHGDGTDHLWCMRRQSMGLQRRDHGTRPHGLGAPSTGSTAAALMRADGERQC